MYRLRFCVGCNRAWLSSPSASATGLPWNLSSDIDNFESCSGRMTTFFSLHLDGVHPRFEGSDLLAKLLLALFLGLPHPLLLHPPPQSSGRLGVAKWLRLVASFVQATDEGELKGIAVLLFMF